jgi:hypothetical protein
MLMPTPLTKRRATRPRPAEESDGGYFLKIILYIVLGSLWIKFSHPLQLGGLVLNGLPFGLFLGLLFASHDHFQVDRKIEYALLVVVAIVTYFLPAGIVI